MISACVYMKCTSCLSVFLFVTHYALVITDWSCYVNLGCIFKKIVYWQTRQLTFLNLVTDNPSTR